MRGPLLRTWVVLHTPVRVVMAVPVVFMRSGLLAPRAGHRPDAQLRTSHNGPTQLELLLVIAVSPHIQRVACLCAREHTLHTH